MPVKEKVVRFALKVTGAAVIVIAALLVAYQGENLLGRESKVQADKPTAAESKRLREAGGKIKGRIVFDSNRSGSFGIYTMNPDGRRLKTLIDSPAHEIYPSWSPDGELVVYARTESLEMRAPSHIYLIGADGRGGRRLAPNGTFPSFSGDGKRVYFERERTKVMAVDLDTGEITELLPAHASEIGGFQVVKPRVSASGNLVAFTSDRNGRWNVWIADIEKGVLIHVGKGCEPTWFPDGKSIVWIFDRNRNTSIPHFDLATRVTKTLQDIGPPRGHEYFPVISSDGKYLLFSACRDGEHSHEKANYQIYIRPLDEDDPIRITFDEFTNRWASLFVEKSGKK